MRRTARNTRRAAGISPDQRVAAGPPSTVTPGFIDAPAGATTATPFTVLWGAPMRRAVLSSVRSGDDVFEAGPPSPCATGLTTVHSADASNTSWPPGKRLGTVS